MDNCSFIPELGYSEFSERLHKRVGDQRIPITGSLEVTMRCNLRCQHCYIPCETRAGQGEPELSLSEIKRILDEITDAGCFWLLLTGGEPFLRKDFLDIYAYARRKGLILTIFTNGTLITPEIADYLAEWRPFKMEITLYGATKETYERVTGIPGSYERCRRGIDLLLERKIPLSLKTPVMTLNHNELEPIKSLVSCLGVDFRFDPVLFPALDGSNRPVLLRLSPEEIIATEKADLDRASRWAKRFTELQTLPAHDKRMYLCGAGKHGYHIDSFGRLYACMTSRKQSYDLRNGTFQEGWDKFLAQVIACEYSPEFECLSCELRIVCAQCPAQAELEHGKSEKRVDFHCQVTKLRQFTFAG